MRDGMISDSTGATVPGLISLRRSDAPHFEVCRLGLLKSDRNPPLRLRFFQPEVVVHGVFEVLLAAQIAFSCLNRYVPKQELNLLKLSACQVT